MNWQKNGLPDAISMPVPGSFSEVFTSETERDFCGDFWYETSFYIPAGSSEKKSYIRFGSVTQASQLQKVRAKKVHCL